MVNPWQSEAKTNASMSGAKVVFHVEIRADSHYHSAPSLVHALQQYQDGTRSGNVMTASAATLTEADMALIAGFYALQEGVETLD